MAGLLFALIFFIGYIVVAIRFIVVGELLVGILMLCIFAIVIPIAIIFGIKGYKQNLKNNPAFRERMKLAKTGDHPKTIIVNERKSKKTQNDDEDDSKMDDLEFDEMNDVWDEMDGDV